MNHFPAIPEPSLRLSERLTKVTLAIVVLSLVLSFLVLALIRNQELRSDMNERLVLTSKIVATQVGAALDGNSREEMGRALEIFSADPSVQWAAIVKEGEGLVAQHGQRMWENEELAADGAGASLSVRRRWGGVIVNCPVVVEGQHVARLIVEADNRDVNKLLARAGLFVAVVLLGASVLVGGLLKLVIGRAIRPIACLAATVERVAGTGDFSLRAEKAAEDEIGQLVDRFNLLLSKLQTQDEEIAKSTIELEKAKRLEALGLLAGGIAHDLNNVLGPMVALPEMLEEYLPEGSEGQELLDLISQSGKRAGVVVQDLLSMARRGKLDLTRLDLVEVLTETLENSVIKSRLEISPDLRIETRLLALGEAWIDGSEPHLSKCFLNLFVNALEAMEGRPGTLDVSLDRIVVKQGDHTDGVSPGEHLLLKVADSGPGMSPEVLERVFEPFYSTKAMGESSGSGLGLTVVFGVVEDHNAVLTVESGPEAGTIFEVYFPARQPVGATDPACLERWYGEERILVVDDYEQQRKLLTMVLKDSGYQVETVENGHEAIERLGTSSYDLMILDMVMEVDFDGLDTYRAIHELYPAMACIVSTGFSENERVREVLRLGAFQCLSKPFSRQDLLRVVRGALSSARGVAPTTGVGHGKF